MTESGAVPDGKDVLDAVRREAMEFAGIGLVRYGFDGKVLSIDRGALIVLELDGTYAEPAEAVGKHVSDLMTYAGPEREGRIRRRVRSKKRVRGLEYPFTTLKGNVKWALHDAYLVADPDTGEEAIQLVLRDITKRKHAEEALRESERQFRETLENISLIAVQTDARAKVLFCNKYLCDLTGWTQEDVVGEDWFDRFIPEDRRESLRGLFFDGRGLEAEIPAHYENPILTRSGGQRLVFWSNSLMRDRTGRPVGVTCIGEDITDRRQAEKALRESEGKYRGFFEAATDAVFLEALDGRVLDCNAAALKMFGYTKAQLLALSVHDLVPDEVGAKLPDIIELHREQGMLQMTSLGKRKSGSVFPTEVSTRVTEIGGEQVAVVFVRDVTERQLAETAAKESEGRYRSLFERVPIGLFRAMPDGQVLEVNQALVQILGYSDRDDLLRCEVKDLFKDRETRQRWRGLIEREGVAREFETQLRRRDGEIIWAKGSARVVRNSAGRVLCYEGSIEDITEHKRVDEERARLATAIEQAVECILVTDTAGVVQYVNPAFETITGYSRYEVVGTSPRILKSGEQSEVFYRELWETISSGEVWRGRFFNRRKDGSQYEEEATVSPLRDASGTITGYVKVSRDVTQEAELQAQLRQSQKMEAVGQLAGGVAHDFNNLLLAIQGHGELALRKLDEDSPACGNINQVIKASRRAADLTRQLLAFSRRQVLKPIDLDFNEIIAELMKMLHRLIGEHIELEIVPGRSLGNVHADPGQMEQVLMNLVVNARDAMSDGGKLTVQVENTSIDSTYCAIHPWAKPGRYIVLSVTDTGCGMSREELDRVFEPFFTTKEAGVGTGLGLSTVYGIVKQHDGLVHVYSEPGKGTTVKVYLPVVDRHASGAQERDDGPPPGGTETILVAEDEDMVRDLATSLLEQAGYTVFAARDGADAVRVFEQHADAIDLAFLDVIMPKMNGRDVCESIRSQKPETRFLFSSGYNVRGVHTHFVLDQGIELVEKPYDANRLLREIRRVLDS